MSKSLQDKLATAVAHEKEQSANLQRQAEEAAAAVIAATAASAVAAAATAAAAATPPWVRWLLKLSDIKPIGEVVTKNLICN